MRLAPGLALSLSVLAPRAVAQCDPMLQLVPRDAVQNAQFGNQIRAGSTTAVVGAWVDFGAAPLSGAAYVLDRSADGWTVGEKLVAGDGETYDSFGVAVALDRDTILVGATDADGIGPRTGAVHAFARGRDGWLRTGKLVAGDGIYAAGFGRGVDLEGDVAIVGAQAQHGAGPWTGAAYAYERVGGAWIELQKLAAADGESGDWFGGSVDIDLGTACIGAQLADADRGAAYVFERQAPGWLEVQKLAPAELDPGDYLGWRVALDGDTLLVGARGDDDRAGNAGAVYVFERRAGGWIQTQKLLASDATRSAAFGIDVAVDGDLAAVGAYQALGHERFTGAAYLFRRNAGGWVETSKLVARDGRSGDAFGFAVALAPDVAFAGAMLDDTLAPAAGSVHAFGLCDVPASGRR